MKQTIEDLNESYERSNKDLLKILLHYLQFEIDPFQLPYLCHQIPILWERGDITYEERNALREYILGNRPKRGKFYDSICYGMDAFWVPWNPDGSMKIQIRIEWLKYQIKKCKT